MSPTDGPADRPPRAAGFFRRFLRLAGPYWNSEEKWKVRGMTAALVLLTIAQMAAPLLTNRWNADFFDALEKHSYTGVFHQMVVLGGIIAVNIVISTLHFGVKRWLQIGWREWLTKQLLSNWMEQARHYQVKFIDGNHDNPDGRIAEDGRIATEVAIELAHSLFYCLLLLGSFFTILWNLSWPVELTLGDWTLPIPGVLVWVAVLYTAVASAIALRLAKPITEVTDKRLGLEADFRFRLAQAREHSEAIALVRGELDERRRLWRAFGDLVRGWNAQTYAIGRLFIFTSGYSVLSGAFPFLVAAPRYLTGAMTLGTLMQTSQAFQQMASALSWPVDNFSRVMEWRASVERVLGLQEAVERLKAEVACPRREAVQVGPGKEGRLAFDGLCVLNPKGEPILRDLEVEIAAGEWVLITSRDPAASFGALALFKVVAGLWPWGQGRVGLPRGARIFFMPQRPYLPFGSLRGAVSYPATPDSFDEPAICKALGRVGLERFAGRLSEREHWERILSPGEQQRLGFARLLLHRPDWVFIEEATDALDSDSEAAMMRLIGEELPGATVLTVGYHSGARGLHPKELNLVRAEDGVIVARRSRGWEGESVALNAGGAPPPPPGEAPPAG